MATVTQSIPALIGGISQQPDELKVPGQVNVAKNVLPDVTHGLLKRPGSQLIASLSDNSTAALNSVDGGKWFHYYRDDDEQYIGQINTSTGDVNMWRCSDGVPFPVNSADRPIKSISITGIGSGYTSAPTVSFSGGGGSGAAATVIVRGGQISEINITNAGSGYTSTPTIVFDNSNTNGSNGAATCTVSTVTPALLASYLSHGSPAADDIQTLTVNDYTFLTNRKKTTAMSSTIEPVRPPEAYIELKQIKYASQYALNLYDSNQTRDVTTATRIKVDRLYDSSNTCGHDDEGRLFFKHLFDQRSWNAYGTTNFVWGVQCGTRSGTSDSGATVNGIKMSDSTCPSTKTGLFSGVGSGTTYTDRNDPDPPDVYVQNTKYFRGDIIQANNNVYWLDTTSRDSGTDAAPSQTDPDTHVRDWRYINTLSNYQAGQVEQHTVRVFDKNHMDANLAVKTVDNSNNVVSSVVNAAETGRENMYFRITTTGQAVPYGEGNSVRYYARYTTTHDLLYGGSGWAVGDTFYVWMNNARYRIEVEETSTSKVACDMNGVARSGLIRPTPTPFDTETTITAESILGSIRQLIVSQNNGISDTEIEQIGNGLYITNGTDFNAATPFQDLLNVVSGSVETVDDLPQQCKHGMVIKVANSDTEMDDYYVKFFGNNDRDGNGTWEECAKPGTSIEIDPSTMPIQLTRNASTDTFDLDFVKWQDATVGDTDPVVGTNPQPSFIGSTVSKILFFRNRLCLLSNENIVLSRPGNFFNFWAKTATTFTIEDVIDVSCSSTYPAIIYDVLQVNAGLLLFTNNQQFLLTTDSDILAPNTAKVNAISTYNFNKATNPISLGTTVGFLDNANKYSRFFEMSNILREGEPTVVEQSKVVSKLFTKDLKLVSNSRENSVIFFSEINTKTIFGYRYHTSGQERVMSSWFEWELSNPLQYHCMLDDALYVVTSNAAKTKRQLIKYTIKLDDNGNFVTQDGDTHQVHLDNIKAVTTASNTYNSSTKITTFPKPEGFEGTGQLAVYDTDSGSELGRYALATINTSDNTKLDVDGDWKSQSFELGYLYEMAIELPTLYLKQTTGERTRADTRSYLTLHRLKFNFGPIGLFDTTLKRKGKIDYNNTVEVVPADSYGSNSAVVEPFSTQTIPVYEKNTNVTITVKSTHPAPATMYSLVWEGDYSNKLYQRV